MNAAPVLLGGQWRAATASGTFQADNPTTGDALPAHFPVSTWADCEAALDAAAAAAAALREIPREEIGQFLTRFADRLEAHSASLAELAHRETGLPVAPRLLTVELPRTFNQLRQAAAAARDGSWALPTLDTVQGLRSCHAALGPVAVFGPNNFPFAFNGIAGGDFAAAIAAGNPVIAKANPAHPGTTQRLAELAFDALGETALPPATVQLLYHLAPADGFRLVSDARLGATAYTGSRAAGLRLKEAADRAGKPIYLELSSINPVVFLPRVLARRADELAEEFAASCLLGSGQFCTNPGLVIVWAGDAAEQFLRAVGRRFAAANLGPLLSRGTLAGFNASVTTVHQAGATLVARGDAPTAKGFRAAASLWRVDAEIFLGNPHVFQTEMFGPASLVVVVQDTAQAAAVCARLEGALTASLYSEPDGTNEADYRVLGAILRPRVGRLLNDRMPTGVAVSAAMNHGGPFPATGHPGFSAVGIPGSLRRFSQLQCFDHVRDDRLPDTLRDANPHPNLWRLIDGRWTTENVCSRR